jgi:DNA-binding LacI/PurR family transcriptional regulator
VSIDGAKGVAAAVTHLAQLGHRRIAYVGLTPELSTGASRLAGYQQAMAASGAAVDPTLVRLGPGSPMNTFGRAATAGLLQLADPPTAIIFGTTEMTSGGYEAVRQAGTRLPQALSVVGWGDPPWFRHVDPTLTAVALSFDQAAEAAMSLLLRRIEDAEEGRTPEPPVALVFDPYLVVRETTAPPNLGGMSG